VLSELAQDWNEDAADGLLWDCLCHQGTCYGATYAAIPHLIEIAQPPADRPQRLSIALFLGYAVLRARLQHMAEKPSEDQLLPGLPSDPDEWDRKLDVFRSLLASLEDRNISAYDRTVRRPRYRRILQTGAVNAGDMDKIAIIRADFWSALPRIGAMCERAYRENISTANVQTPLLGGVAATAGQIDIADLLYFGKEGVLSCANCRAIYQYVLHDDRVAIYADEPSPSHLMAGNKADDRLMRDYKAGTISHADGFVMPAQDHDTLMPFGTRLLELAKEAETTLPQVLVRSFLGRIHCCRCGETASIMTCRFEA
jgi:hypothetical protein